MECKQKTVLYTASGVVLVLVGFFLWTSGMLNGYFPFFLTTDGWNRYEREINNPNNDDNKDNDSTGSPEVTLTEVEARLIAEQSCIKGGEALAPGTHNEATKTWWFDANLNSAREGCTPACVVSEETSTAEVNWRCIGLTVPDTTDSETPPVSDACGIENCHGLDIVCSPTPAEICTEIYEFGDVCRQFAECGVVAGLCEQIENPNFTTCKSCVQKCELEYPDALDKAFECESRCGEWQS